MISPERYRPSIAFAVGWLSLLGKEKLLAIRALLTLRTGWLFTTASTVVFCAQSAVIIAGFYHPDYVYTQWQVYLIYLLIITIPCLLIIFLPSRIPTAEKGFLLLSIVGVVVAIITVLATSKTKQPASVLSNWTNSTGWPDGLAFLLATGQAMYGFLGMDGVTHIAEELPNPGRNVPRILMLIMLIGSGSCIPWTIAFLFSTNDLGSVGSSLLPIYTVFNQALTSQAAATFFTVWIVTIYFGALISCLVTSGRLIWAFSRDGGLPYSKTFAKVHPTLNAPVNATVLATIVIGLFGLLYIASTTALTALWHSPLCLVILPAPFPKRYCFSEAELFYQHATSIWAESLDRSVMDFQRSTSHCTLFYSVSRPAFPLKLDR